jgi:omega-amidase
MKDYLHITLLQWDLSWHQALPNRRKAEELMNANPQSDLYILPEMFTTGFTMDPAEVAETMEGKTVKWIRSQAIQRKSAIAGSLVISENGHFYNRMICILPTGEITSYDKRHLFSYAGEHEHYSAGDKIVEVPIAGWNVRLLICYDLRFPVWSRNTSGTDLMIYVANWPQVRSVAWNTLLTARAIENQCFVAGVNRIGKDGNGIEYQGDTQLINAGGETIATLFDKEGAANLALSASELIQFRDRYPFLKDRDKFKFL